MSESLKFMIVKVGIAGLGTAGITIHGKYLKESEKFKIVAVCDLQKERAKDASEEFSCKYYEKYEDFLRNEDIQLVVIASPNHLHGPMTIEALENGKHVIVEKPMCLSLREADQIIEVAKKSNCVLTIHYNRRWDGDFLTIKKAIDEGLIGKTILIQSRWIAGPYPKSWASKKQFTGGGAFLSFGSHLTDQILTLTGTSPVSVYGLVRSVIGEDDYFNSFLVFENGLIGQVEMSRGSRVVNLPRWYIIGEKGDITMSHPKNGESECPIIIKNEGKEKKLDKLESRWGEFYENVYGALTEGEELAVKPEDGRRCVAIAEAIARSSIENKVILVKVKFQQIFELFMVCIKALKKHQ